MSHVEQVFVYGTLRPPRPDTPPDDSRYYPQIATHIQAVAPARVAQADLYNLGTYPAAKSGQGELQGDLLTVNASALAIMDHIEGHPSFFKRGKVMVQIGNGAIEAWIYWAPDGLVFGRRRIVSGDWFERRRSPSESESVLSPEEEAILQDQVAIDATLLGLVRRFAQSECSWLSSVRPGGRAHSAPIWHVWYRGRAYLVTLSGAVKTANILENPGVVITHPDPVNPVIIEGWATLAVGMEPQLQPLFANKYNWNIDTDVDYDTIIEITPTKLLAWGQHGEGRWPGAAVLRVWSL